MSSSLKKNGLVVGALLAEGRRSGEKTELQNFVLEGGGLLNQLNTGSGEFRQEKNCWERVESW
jgi:hypothetical protein